MPESFDNRVSHTRESFGDELTSPTPGCLNVWQPRRSDVSHLKRALEVEPDSSQSDSRREATGSLRRTSYN